MRSQSEKVRLAASVLLGLGVVTGAVELGSSEGPVAVADVAQERYYREGELPEYPGSLEFPMGDGLSVNGLPIRMSYYSVDDKPEAVRDYYLSEFRRMGYPAKSRAAGVGYSVTALINGGADYVVVGVLPNRDRVDVFPAIYPMTAQPAETTEVDSRIPYSEDATGIMRVSTVGEGAGDVVSYSEPLLSLDAVVGRIRDSLGRDGWDLEGLSNARLTDTMVVLAKRGGTHARFTVRKFAATETGAHVVAQFTGETE